MSLVGISNKLSSNSTLAGQNMIQDIVAIPTRTLNTDVYPGMDNTLIKG